jgi:sulfur-oxidizing protein SoxB
VTGIDVILGGHTHDALPRPVAVSNSAGKTLVTNAGSSGKFLGVLDLELGKGEVKNVRYHLLPVYSDLLKPDAEMHAFIERVRKPHAVAFDAKVATAGELLYRRANFNGTVDQVICDALRAELNADLALSPGFRWGNTLLPGEAITMEDLLSETAITYPQVYVQEMTGEQIKGIMEDVCDNLFNPDPYYQQGGDMVRIGGMDYSCAPAEAIGHRISDLTLDDGKRLEPGKTYRVAGWASVNPQEGKPVADVVAAYLRNAQDARPKKLNKVAIKGLVNNPGMAG